MYDDTIIVMDFVELTNNPKLSIMKLPMHMTIQQLIKRLQHSLLRLNLPFGRINLYQRGKLLMKHQILIDLPQGTIKCTTVKMALCPIMELETSESDCRCCGQQYRDNANNACSQCCKLKGS